MSKKHSIDPSDIHAVISFEESQTATAVEFQDARDERYRLTAPIRGEHYADIAEWTLERAVGKLGGEWAPVAFAVPDNAGQANDLLRVWTDQFQRMRDEAEDDEE